MGVNTQDRHPAIAVKEACLGKSGVYYYTKAEMIARGMNPSVDKPLYSEYRPREVLERCKDKFAFAATTIEHTDDETHPGNFRHQAVGVIGDNIIVKGMNDGEVGLFGKMAFYTQDGYSYYEGGGKETSADYRSVVKPDPTGKHDFVLTDILSVNGVVLTQRGRGGPSVRVQDSLNIFGGKTMAGKKGALGIFGIGRSKDDKFSLSELILGHVKKLHTMDAAAQQKAVTEVMGYVNDLGEGKHKDLLIGAVKDAFSHPSEVIAKETDVKRTIDGLYQGALAVDLKDAEDIIKSLGTQDGGADAEKAKKEAEEKEAAEKKKTQDAAPLTPESVVKMVDDALEKGLTRVTDGFAQKIATMVDESVQKALGVQPDKEKGGKTTDGGTDGTQTQDSLDEVTREEGAFILNGSF
jgi:hypothetical protein